MTGFNVETMCSDIKQMGGYGYVMNGVCKILLRVLTKQFLLSSEKLHTFVGKGFESLIYNVDEAVKSRHSGGNRSLYKLKLFDITGFRPPPE